ncbi:MULTISPECIES: hypothetical protein [Streptomyces]|uniref:Uncharacterized protein n=1 Tax=Streptomyces canarius TaxID=285453 RepID=A0ABQ3D642_9ACTN|nr:hypothetical protein [Streptomyces canarius]GHA56530.1 hypothetical protein GCM10010345_71280 [Streptomyces canarius]
MGRVRRQTLRDLVAEATTDEKAFKAKARITLRSSYSSSYRQMPPPLPNTWGFKCDTTACRPVMDALACWWRSGTRSAAGRCTSRAGSGG